MNENLTLTGSVHILVKDRFGNIKLDQDFGKNVITNVGLAVISGLVGNTGAQTAFTYLAVGTSATAAAASQTTLGTEVTDTGLARAAATVSRVTTTQTNDTLQLVYTWTSTGAKTLAEAGIFNNTVASGTSIMLARKVLSSTVTLANTDTLTITYKVTFS